MAEVKLTQSSSDETGEEHVIPNLMTRSRMEHDLESLRRDRDRVEHAMAQLEEESTRLLRPINQDLMSDKAREITGMNEKIEEAIQGLINLNKGINPERDEFERKEKEKS
ncbi:hypothetical protein LCGC14_0810270 [marine sediment metagenome]|uniref:Uncharacterized protein n=1 Tax=marine sediment metagenome TaxID=412755 RepID=A0A0F9SUG0_9ZZZZ